MLVEFEHRGDVCVLRLHGRFATGQDSAYLRTRTDEIKCSGFSKVLADFTEVSYIDSTGIEFLLVISTHVLHLKPTPLYSTENTSSPQRPRPRLPCIRTRYWPASCISSPSKAAALP